MCGYARAIPREGETMKTKTYNSGPWHVSISDLGGESPCYVVYGNDNLRVATLNRGDGICDEENARLILSAPTLLKMLEFALDELKILSSNDRIASRRWINIEIAIKQAKGG